jgi:6-pyruvoyl-tetrahydropterin synthase
MKKEKIIEDKDVKVKILVCYYQPWELPKESIYFPIQAGKAVSKFKLKMQGDDTGDNISAKNATLSEFTAWYWGWKNIKKFYPNIEYAGLSHYRRFFALNKPFEGYTLISRYKIPKMENYENLIIQKLENNDIILVKPSIFGVNLKSQYASGHYVSDLYCMKDIIHEICPEYDESFLYFFENNSTISLYCMFIARYELFNKYFEWLFPLLFELEKRIDTSKYNAYQKRVFAFLAERLLNVYVRHNKLKVIYEPVFFITNGEKIIEPKMNIKTFFKGIIKYFIPYGILRHYRIKKEKKFDAE